MPTHAELSAKLLSEAAIFFRTIADQNKDIKKQMTENAAVFDQVAELLTKAPMGKIDDKTHGEMAGALLHDAAQFFRRIGDGNSPIKDQMDENAKVFENLGNLVAKNPVGILE